MRLPANKIVGIVFFIALYLLSGHGLSHAKSQEEQKAGVVEGSAPAIPDLSDIIPLATALTGRLTILEKRLESGPDIAAIQKRYDVIATDLKVPSDQLDGLKNAKDYRLSKLIEMRRIVRRKNRLFEEISQPVLLTTRQLGVWRREWLEKKKNWNKWEPSFLAGGEFEQLKPSFEKTNDTIDTALNLISLRLEALLRAQERAGHTQIKIDVLTAELDDLIMEKRQGALFNASPLMLSSEYFSQFRGGIWVAVKNGLDEISWPESRVFAQHGWIILVQGIFSIIMIISVYRNRRVLTDSKKWFFLAARPFSAGLFLGGMVALLLYEYAGAQTLWKMVNIIIFGLSFARLSSGLVETFWKRELVYGLMITLIVTRLLDLLSFPPPLFRLYMILAALAFLLLCLRWAGKSKHHKEPRFYTLFLRLASLFFAVIIIAQFWGKDEVALFLFNSFIDSMGTALVFMLFLYMVRGGLEWLFRTAPIRRAEQFYGDDKDAAVGRVARFINVAACGLVLLPGILMIWSVYDSLEAAMKGVLSVGFNLGNQRISVGLVITAAGILYGSFFISWGIRKLLMDEVLIKHRVEKGVRHSMTRLVNYVVIFIGFLLALSTLGFEVSKITIILSALGVGIGFGLQGVVNNFVSGLILLFERPVRVGDSIEINGKWAKIARIGIRATTVQTRDHADLIIPNADLINSQVTNWTLSNRKIRITLPVGVAHGSDVPLVMEILMACTQANHMVAKTPAPRVLFMNFGESTLDFELRVWLKDADYRRNARSTLFQEIDRRFREANIDIAFPQRDLHLRSVDESVGVVPHGMSFEKQEL